MNSEIKIVKRSCQNKRCMNEFQFNIIDTNLYGIKCQKCNLYNINPYYESNRTDYLNKILMF